MRNKVIAGNWKMHKSLEEANQFLDEVKELKTKEHVTAIVCAPFIHLTSLVQKAEGTDIKIAAQNMHYEDTGAFTGEVSPAMLQDIGVTHVIIGHSERREYFNETDETVNKKVKATFEKDLKPIVCVGETLELRESGSALSFIKTQVEKALSDLNDKQISETIIAYEPIWAIGTGKTASSSDANEVCSHIRETVKSLAGASAADQMTIQYGGSVKPANIDELLSTSDIDGALVGGASLEADSFSALVEAGNRVND